MQKCSLLLEDNHLLVIDKPAGLLTQGEESAEAFGKGHIQTKFLHAVHRLDRVTSGICLFAKSSKALSRLNASLREGKWRKVYLAQVEKEPEEKEGVLIDYLTHGDRKALVDPKGKRCELSYRVIGSGLLEIDLKTGRYHQIRAQLGARGMPIVGDEKYGAESKRRNITLHHSRLEFPHPTTGEQVVVIAPVLNP